MTPYINLTSGIELLPKHPEARFVRLQSSHFEAGALWRAICDVDYSFLLSAALEGALLLDCGSRRSAVSRAQWQGVPWVKHAYRRGIGEQPDKSDMAPYFDQVYVRSSGGQREIGLKKLRYVHKMTGAKDLNIVCESVVSTMDGDYDGLRAILSSGCVS